MLHRRTRVTPNRNHSWVQCLTGSSRRSDSTALLQRSSLCVLLPRATSRIWNISTGIAGSATGCGACWCGAVLGNNPSLREGLLCEGCGLSNRKRLMHSAILEEYARTKTLQGSVLLLEGLSPLYRALAARIPDLIGSEYLGDDCVVGKEYEVPTRGRVRHESLTTLSFGNGSLNLLAHLDILEHVPDYRAALRECFRVLKPGGSMVFTCPFFAQRHEPLIRARVKPDGAIEHLEPPEWHGDPLNKEGILAYYHHGWGLLDDLRAAGFADVRLGVVYDVFSGFVSNNYPGGGYGLML